MNIITRALRGATTIEIDSPEQIQQKTCELFDLLINENNLTKNDIVSIYLSITRDITSYNPATALRLNYGFDDVPMICGQEAHIDGGLQLCIRTMIHINAFSDQKLSHIYLHGAQALRQNWTSQISQ